MSTSTALRPVVRQALKYTRNTQLPPAFLLPSLALAPCKSQQTASFSSTFIPQYPRDNNPRRGQSPVRRTGVRQPLSVHKTALPKPLLDAWKKDTVSVPDDHGLYQFFNSKESPLNSPEEDSLHGRAWRPSDLREKSWEDLHALWWVCVKERNRIATQDYERSRLKAGFGDSESKARLREVKLTQRAIKQTLTERYYAWQNAQVLAKRDKEIDLSGNGPVYNPTLPYEDEPVEAENPEDIKYNPVYEEGQKQPTQ